MIDADQAYLLEANNHPTHPGSHDADLEQFEVVQAIYDNFMNALPAYERKREKEQERITLALIAERSDPIKSLALKTALKKRRGYGSKVRTRHKRKRKIKRTRQRGKRKRTKRKYLKLNRPRKKG